MTHAIWWETEGSAMRPLPNEDIEEFAKRITAIAWSNGQYVEREACARVCDATVDYWVKAGYLECAQVIEAMNIAEEIRARGEA